MTSSSGLYGEVTLPAVTLAEPTSPTGQDVNSTNSTGLYGGASTPIPDSSGNLVVRGDLLVLSGNILTTATTGNVFPTNATTLNVGNAATTINIGADTGTTTINNNLVVDGSIGSDSITTGPITATTVTGTYFNGTDAKFGNIQIAITDNNTIDTSTGDLKLNSTTGNIGLIGADTLYTDQSTFLLFNSPTTVTAFDSATTLNFGDVTGTTFIRNDVAIGGDLKINGNDIKSNGGTVAITLSGNDVTIADDLTINGNNVNLAQGTTIGYNENNDRHNRPQVQSTSGNNSGLRVIAPNATTSSGSSLSVFATNDINNGEFLTVNANGSTTAPFAIRTGKYTGGVLGTSGKSISFTDNGVVYAGINPNGPTIGTDLTTKAYVDGLTPDVPTYDTNVVPVTGGVELDLREIQNATYTIVGSTKFLGGTNVTISETNPNEVTISAPDTNTTYTIDASATTGGANLNLNGSDSSVDSVAYKGSGATTVTRTDANTITISSTDTNTTYTQDVSSTTGGANVNLNGSDASVDSVAYKGAGSVTVTATDSSTVTITGTDTNTTYNIDATSTTGGANLNLNGSDSSVDPVAFKGSGATTVTRTDANTVTISSTDNNTTYTQDVSSTTGGANLNLVGSDATTDSVKFAGGTNVSIVATDASTMTINATDTNTTYDFAASSTTGGANLTLTGSDSTTDTVKVSSGTGITVADVSATEISITNSGVTALSAGTGIGVSGSTGSVTVSNTGVTSAVAGTGIGVSAGTGAVTFSNTGVTSLAASTYLSVNASTGSVTVSTNATNANTPSTIVARDASGNFSAGTITANLANGTRVLGALTATPSTTYTFPAPPLTSITDNNGLDAVSSYNSSPTTLGNGAQGQFTHFFGDTFAGSNTGAVFSLKSANGNSETTGTIPFTGLAPVAPSAVTSSNVIGGLNFNGYATSGFTDYIATQNQGGGYNAIHAGQIQFAPIETFADGTLTISGATITAVSRVNVAQTVTAIAGTRGQLTIPSTLAGVGTAVVVTGTNAGTGTGITAGTYYIVANNGGVGNSTQITLSATVGGAPITTTPGTVTGLTFTRQLITVTYSAQTSVPFGLNAKVTISGFTNVTSGTFMCVGAPTATSATIGATSSGVPALSGSQSVSCPTVTAGGTLFRVRGFKAATPLNPANRTEYINHSVATATYKSDQFNFQGGSNTFNYLALNAALAEFRISGTIGFKDLTGTNLTGDKLTYSRVYGEWSYSTTVTPAAANTAYVFPLGTADTNNVATVGSTSRLIPGAAGVYNFQFSVQVINADNGNDHIAYIWLRKNGVDVANSMSRVTVVKSAAQIASWNFILNSANTTDYWELAYAVDSTQITFPNYAATAFGPATPTLITTLTPVGA